jgi:hypothetical protein
MLKALSSDIQKRYWQRSPDAVVSAGQACGIIGSIPSAGEVIENIITGSVEIIRNLHRQAGRIAA